MDGIQRPQRIVQRSRRISSLLLDWSYDASYRDLTVERSKFALPMQVCRGQPLPRARRLREVMSAIAANTNHCDPSRAA